MALDLQDGRLAGIAAFYAVVNIPKESLTVVFREMERVLQPGGLLLLAFHTGDEVLHEDELWGLPISLDFHLQTLRAGGKKAGFPGLSQPGQKYSVEPYVLRNPWQMPDDRAGRGKRR